MRSLERMLFEKQSKAKKNFKNLHLVEYIINSPNEIHGIIT